MQEYWGLGRQPLGNPKRRSKRLQNMAGNPQATRREWAFGNEAVIWPTFWSMHLCFAPQNTRLLLQTHKMCSRRQKYGCGHRCLRRPFICSCLSLMPGWRTTSYFRAASHVRATPTLLLMRKTDGVGTASAPDQLDGVARIWWWSAVLSTSDRTVSVGRDPI